MGNLVSVIVPVYNAKDYLRQCVRSVLAQTHSNFELLLIDDGSQDGSAELCQALRDTDPRVRFLPRAHQGVSAVRNAGLDEARGDYVFFLDSDDAIHPLLLEVLVELCESTGASLATESYLRLSAEPPFDFFNHPAVRPDGPWNYTLLSGGEPLSRFFSRENEDHFYGIGGKLIRRRDIGELRFDPALRNAEDTLFICQLLQKGLRSLILWEAWYVYRQHLENTTHHLTVQLCGDRVCCWNKIFERELERGRQDNAAFCAWHLTRQLRWMYERGYRDHEREVVRYLRALAKEEIRGSRFQLLSRSDRWKFRLTFGCFPVYIRMFRVHSWLKSLRARRQAGLERRG